MNNRKGFTLAELLIVVAIIAVLVAVAIPVFLDQMEKAAESVDLANLRSAYATMTVEAASGENSIAPITVDLKQTKAGWITPTAAATLKDLTKDNVSGAPADGSGNTAAVEWLSDAQAVKITFNGSGSGEPGGGSGSGSTVTYDSRKAFMQAAAAGLNSGFTDLIPEEKRSQAESGMNRDTFTAYNGDVVTVKELNISQSILNRGAYWTPEMHTWGEILTNAGMDVSQVGELNGYVYFDADFNPVSISYYDENNNYCYVFMDDGETITLSRMPGERQHAGYYKDYAKSLAN